MKHTYQIPFSHFHRFLSTPIAQFSSLTCPPLETCTRKPCRNVPQDREHIDWVGLRHHFPRVDGSLLYEVDKWVVFLFRLNTISYIQCHRPRKAKRRVIYIDNTPYVVRQNDTHCLIKEKKFSGEWRSCTRNLFTRRTSTGS
jgi:hypothetical protein